VRPKPKKFAAREFVKQLAALPSFRALQKRLRALEHKRHALDPEGYASDQQPEILAEVEVDDVVWFLLRVPQARGRSLLGKPKPRRRSGRPRKKPA
jgi:hypothetical protein